MPDQAVRRCGSAKSADTVSAEAFLHVSLWLQPRRGATSGSVALQPPVLISVTGFDTLLCVLTFCEDTQWLKEKTISNVLRLNVLRCVGPSSLLPSERDL